MTLRPARTGAVVASFALLAACSSTPESDRIGSGETSGYPVSVESCGHVSDVAAMPERVITMNQGATEVVLALGLEDQLVGTAYLDDSVPDRWKAAYESVDVLSDEYPAHEAVLAAEPDFVYASYISAFGPEAAGTPDELSDLGIASYTSPLGCGDGDLPDVSFETVWDEIDTVAAVLGARDEAAAIRAEQTEQLTELAATGAGAGLDVFWYDSGDRTALAGAGEGGPQLILEAVGATNLFAGLPGGWADVSWESVIDADPDVIVLGDASWSSADEKIAYLESDPALSELTAVKERRFVVLPYSATTPGVRLVEGAQTVSAGLAALNLD